MQHFKTHQSNAVIAMQLKHKQNHFFLKLNKEYSRIATTLKVHFSLRFQGKTTPLSTARQRSLIGKYSVYNVFISGKNIHLT